MCKFKKCARRHGAGFGHYVVLMNIQSEGKSVISPTYEFAVDIFQEGQLWLKEIHSCYRDVLAP